ncbi:MAG: hypothetical protein Q4D38_06825 [Planctomycetia bacterium]|nr:hypothetical protein [Planctomycetia bacterium]
MLSLLVICLLASGTNVYSQAAKKESDQVRLTRKFLEGLQREGFCDLGIYYLEREKAANRLPPEILETYDFELAMMAAGALATVRTVDEYLELCDKTIVLLEKFTKEKQDHEYFGRSAILLSRMRLGKADFLATTSKGKKVPEEERTKMIAQARETLLKNVENLKQLEDIAKKNAAKINPEENREAYLNALIPLNNIRLSIGDSYYELSRTYPAGSNEQKENLNQALARYNQLKDKYADTLPGVEGTIGAGQVLFDLKKFTGSENAAEVLLIFLYKYVDKCDDFIFPYYSRAASIYVGCYLDPSCKMEKAEDFEFMEKIFQALYATPQTQELTSRRRAPNADLILFYINYVRFLELYGQKAIPAELKTTADKRLKDIMDRLVKIKQNPHAETMADLTAKYAPESVEVQKETNYNFENYKECKVYKELGTFANNLWVQISEKQVQANEEPDPAKKSAIIGERNELTKKAIEVYEYLDSMHEQMEKDNASIETLLKHRLYRGYLYFYIDEHMRTVEIMDEIVQKYPKSQFAMRASSFALQIYPVLIERVNRQERSSGVEPGKRGYALKERGMMFKSIQNAQKLLDEGDELGDEPRAAAEKAIAKAWSLLSITSIKAGDEQNAIQCLKKIPEDSESRGDTEIALGFTLWKEYVAYMRADDDKKTLSAAEAAEVRDRARQYLVDGAQHLKKRVESGAEATELSVAAVVTLCQVLAQSGKGLETQAASAEPEQGAEGEATEGAATEGEAAEGATAAQTDTTQEILGWLNDPIIGPYTLYKANSPLVAGLKQPILNTALQAYVTSNDEEEAEKILNDLEAMASEGGDAGMEERLTMTYIRLGQELEETLRQLTQEGDAENVAKVQKGFEMFLDRIRKRDSGNTFGSLMWVAQMYLSMADGVSGKSVAAAQAAERYYSNAAETYADLSKRVTSDPEFLTRRDGASDEDHAARVKKTLSTINMRIAACLVKQGDYEKAIEIYGEILKEQSGAFSLQLETAEAMLAWGRQTKDPAEKIKIIKKSLMGDVPVVVDKKKQNAIFGFNKLFQTYDRRFKTEKRPEELELIRVVYFHIQACLVEARLILAEAGDSPESNFKSAQKRINNIFQTYDDMGGETESGEQYRDIFDALLRRAQTGLKEDAKGLKALTKVVYEAKDEVDPVQVAKNRTIEEEEDARLAQEEDRARRAMTPPAKPMNPIVLWGGIGLAVLVTIFGLIYIMMPKKGLADKRRAAMAQSTTLSEVPTDFDVPSQVTVPEGLGEEPAPDATEAMNVFAALGIGDAPVHIPTTPTEKVSLDIPLFTTDEPAAPSAPEKKSPPEKKPAPKPVKKPAAGASSHGEESGGGTKSEPEAKRPVVRKPVVKKPAPERKGEDEASTPTQAPSAQTPPTSSAPGGEESSASKPVVKKVIKKVVKRPSSDDSSGEGLR